MPEEKTIIGVPEDVAEKLKMGGAETIPDVLDVPGKRSEVWIDGDEKKVERNDAQFISSYERRLKEIQSSPSSSIVSQVTIGDDDIRFDADAIRHIEDAVSRVERLLRLAEAKGPIHAVSVAKEIDAYTLDRTHDRLADELSERLRERGMLKDNE